MRMTFRILAAAGTLALLSACSTGLIANRDSPDEFAVQRQAPLVVPPDFQLVPPAPGAPRPGDSTAAQQAHEQARASVTRAAGVLQSLQQLAVPQYKAWQAAVAPLAAGSANPPAREVERGSEAHKELRKAAEHAASSCAQLREQEQALASSLSALGEQLRAAS